MVRTKLERIEKFVHGLNPTIACNVKMRSTPLQTYSEALNKALRLEVVVHKMN